MQEYLPPRKAERRRSERLWPKYMVAEAPAQLGINPYVLLLAQICYGSNHGRDAWDTWLKAHGFGNAHFAGELRGHNNLTTRFYLGPTADLAHHAVHVYNVYATLAGILCEAAKGAKIEGCWIPGLTKWNMFLHERREYHDSRKQRCNFSFARMAPSLCGKYRVISLSISFHSSLAKPPRAQRDIV